MVGGDVGMLIDSSVQGDVDDLLAAAATPSSNLMRRLFASGWRPVGLLPTLFYAQMIFTKSYNEARDGGANIEESWDFAYVVMINHPFVQKFSAAIAAAMVDQMAGVEG